MDILLPEDLATVVEYYPPRRPTSATVRFLSPSGASLATPTAMVDTALRTISVVTDAETVTVTGSTGSLVAGRYYWWVSADGQESRTLVSQVDSTAVLLEWPVARSLPEVNDTLKGARITATISVAATVTRGENYAIEWTTTHADGTVIVERKVAHVVRANARPAADVGFVKSCMTVWWPDYVASRAYGYFLALAERTSDRVFRRIRRTKRYLQLLWDASDFEGAARIALQYELAVDGLVPGGNVDAGAFKEALDKELDREIEDVISSRPYDEDDSGSVNAIEVRTINSISLRRS